METIVFIKIVSFTSVLEASDLFCRKILVWLDHDLRDRNSRIESELLVLTRIRINLPLFSTVVPSNICMFLSCRPFVVMTTLSTGLVGVSQARRQN